MTQDQIYQNIAQRTGGDIYLGVVGPVRSGKSTFIKRFAELMLLPRIKNEARRARAHDELPQSAAGRTIMTRESRQARAFGRRQLQGAAHRLRRLHGRRRARP